MLRIRRWFNNLLIRKKIIAIYVPLIIIPLFVLALVSNFITTNTVIKKTTKNISDNSKLINTRIDGMLTNAESCANILAINLNKVVSLSSNPQRNQLTDLQLHSQINNQLTFALTIFPDVENAVFIDTENRTYCSDYRLEARVEGIFNSGLLEKIDKTKGMNLWFPMERRKYLSGEPGDPILSLGKKIIDVNTGEKLGYLLLGIKETELSLIYKNIGPALYGSYFIVDGEGNVISSQHDDELLKPVANNRLRQELVANESMAEIRTVDNKKTLVTSKLLTKLHWKLVSFTPVEELTRDNRNISLLIVGIGLLCLIFALFGAAILSKFIANPIIKLTRHMTSYKDGNIEMYYGAKTEDEIGWLASGFNTMLGRIKELIEKVEFEQKKKKEYELALIHSQIKPHFLYNTLDVIYALSEMGRIKEVQKATKSLADFFRVALSRGNELISIKEEIDNVKNYMFIQKIRYSDIFDYEIDIPEEILSFIILKMTIQPLVENSIYHGLKENDKKGKITVKGHMEGTNIFIDVSDDGVGMSEDRVKEVMLVPQEKASKRQSFGLSSVNERIRLYFGEEFGLKITSVKGKGTQAVIKIPALILEETAND